MTSSQSMRWPEVAYPYPAHLKAAFLNGTLFREWYRTYEGKLLFCAKMLTSRQIPHSGPIKNPMFFHELFLGTQYLDAGYGALFFYRRVEDEACYAKAYELLGGKVAAQFITPNSEKSGRAPDLLVFEPSTGRFRFVECKGETEPFTLNQTRRFADIERYLNSNPPPNPKPLSDSRNEKLFPSLGPGQWVHIARLEQNLAKKDVTVTTGTRRKWDETTFFDEAKAQLIHASDVSILRRVYEHAQRSRFTIVWGTGSQRGSFGLKYGPLCPGSIVTIWTSGRLALNFGWLHGSEAAETFRDKFKHEVAEKMGLRLPEDYQKRHPEFPIDAWGHNVEGLISILDNLLLRWTNQ